MDPLTEVSAIAGGSFSATPVCPSVGEQRVSTTHCTIDYEPGPPALIAVNGDLDRVSLPMVRAALAAAHTTGDVQLDLSAVELADLCSAEFLTGPHCSGIAVLTPSRAVERAISLLARLRERLSAV
jgi:hypothetical protein